MARLPTPWLATRSRSRWGSARAISGWPLRVSDGRVPVLSWAIILFGGKCKNGSAGYSGNDLHLCPRVAALRSEKASGTGQDVRQGDDRVPPCVERAQSHVRSRNENPGAGDRINQRRGE